MRIGLVTEEYPPAVGPVADHVFQLAREARRLGHTVRILTGAMPDLEPGGALLQRLRAAAGGRPGPAAPASPPDREVIRLGRSRPLLRGGRLARMAGGLGLGGAVRGALHREQLDVVHLHGPLTPVLPLLALHHAAGPVVGTFHRPLERGPGRLLDGVVQRYLDRLDAAVVTSRADLGGLPARIRGELRVIPPGVDVDRLGRGRPIRRYQDGKLNVLHAAGLEPRGGLEALLRALERVRRTVELRLLVLGGGPLLPRYRAAVPRALEAEVVFVQPSAEARPDWLATADVCCVPAAAPQAVLEALAAGRPVLAADLPVHAELLTHGREGELLAADDVGPWARALVRLAREPLRGAAYGERGRASAQRHGWPAVAREILGLYRAIGVRG